MVIQTSIKLKPLWKPRRSCSICPLCHSRHLSRDCLLPEKPNIHQSETRRLCCLRFITPPLFIYLCKWMMAISSRRSSQMMACPDCLSPPPNPPPLTHPPQAHNEEVIRWKLWMSLSTSDLQLHVQMLVQIALQTATQTLPVPCLPKGNLNKSNRRHGACRWRRCNCWLLGGFNFFHAFVPE